MILGITLSFVIAVVIMALFIWSIFENERWEKDMAAWIDDAKDRDEAKSISMHVQHKEPKLAKYLRSDEYARRRGWL